MNTIQQLKNELTAEYQTTKRFFNNFPEGKNDYTPHEKSMKLMPLATHVAEVFGWPETILNTEKIDFAAGDYKPTVINNKQELQQSLEDNYQKGISALNNIQDEAKLNDTWGMYMGEQKLAEWDKYSAIRHGLNQATHHRAQLGVYYRLNDVPVPGSYGPTADEQEF